MDSKLFEVETGLVTNTCLTCGVLFAMPRTLTDRHKRDHESFYCPNGHTQHYVSKSDVELAKEEAAKLKVVVQQKEQAISCKKNVIKNQDYRIRSLKGQITKLRKKIA